MDEIYQASIWKRIIADAIDFFLCLIVFLCFSLPQYLGAWDLFGMDAMRQQELADRKATGLFQFSEDGTQYEYISFDMSKEDRPAELKRLVSAIQCYYLDYKVSLPDEELSEKDKSEITNSWVNINILDIDPETLQSDVLSIADIDDAPETAVLLESLTLEDNVYTQEDEEYWTIVLNTFNNNSSSGSYDRAVTDYAGLPHMKEMSDKRRTIYNWQSLWSLSIPVFIFYFLIPCLLPHCQTLGKKFEKIGAVSRDGYNATLFQRLSRNILQTLFVYLSGGFLVFVPLIGDLIILCITKNHRSLADYAAATVVIDLSKSTLVDGKDAPRVNEYQWQKYEKN